MASGYTEISRSVAPPGAVGPSPGRIPLRCRAPPSSPGGKLWSAAGPLSSPIVLLGRSQSSVMPVQPESLHLAGLDPGPGGVVRHVEREGPPALVELVVEGRWVAAEGHLAPALPEHRGELAVVLLGHL